MNRKIELTDLTFLIPVRIDSKDRLENLGLILDFIKSHFNTTVTVIEADKKELVHNAFIDHKIFIEDHDAVFHRTKYLNKASQESSSPFLAIWDTDVLIPSHQIELALKYLRNKDEDMVFPYDGRFFFTSKVFKQLYQQQKNIDVFELNEDKFSLPAGSHSVGGAFIVNREAYINAGMENENFYGWGPEDVERVKRWEILGYRIKKIEGALYHLQHPRMQNSWFASQKLELQNRKELVKVCQMSHEWLNSYVKSFPWMKSTPNSDKNAISVPYS